MKKDKCNYIVPKVEYPRALFTLLNIEKLI